MASSRSAEEICTFATVALLKRKPVVSIDDTTEEAKACASVYAMLRDELLESFAWTFATGRVQLQALADAPDYQYDYQYELPSDCLMPLEARVSYGSDGLKWVVEGNRILTNSDEVYLKYVRRITEPGNFSPLFANALSYRIASALALPLTGEDKLTQAYWQQSEVLARRGEARDAQKGTQEEFQGEGDSWVGSRNSSRLAFRTTDGWVVTE